MDLYSRLSFSSKKEKRLKKLEQLWNLEENAHDADKTQSSAEGDDGAHRPGLTPRPVATPGTRGRPRASTMASPTKEKKTSVSEAHGTPSLLLLGYHKLAASRIALVVVETLSRLLGLLRAAQGHLKSSSFWQRTTAMVANSHWARSFPEFPEKATARAQDFWASMARPGLEKLQLGMVSFGETASRESRLWWSHTPAPLAFGCLLALVAAWILCTASSTWPVHIPDLNEPRAVPEMKYVFKDAEESALKEEKNAAEKEEQRVDSQESSSLRLLEARSLLRSGQFELAHRELVSLLGGRVAFEAGLRFGNLQHWEFPAPGNFSRAGYLADLGVTLVSLSRYQEALPLLASGLQHEMTQNPATTGNAAAGFILNAMGVCYRQLGDSGSAARTFSAAVQFAPNNSKLWNNLGVVAMDLGRFQQADDAFLLAGEALGSEAAAQTGPKLAVLVHNVQLLHSRALGQSSGASQIVEEAALELWYENDGDQN